MGGFQLVHLLFGDDDFSLGEHLASLKATVQPAELRDVNITVLDGTRLQFSELTSNCDTVPFLAEKRMVVVEGLLSRFERRAPSRSSASQNADPSPDISEWKALADYLPTVPETTELVFTDGALGRGNRLLASIRPHANVSTFPTLGAAQVRRWINDRATATETEIEPAAVDLLIETIGSDLRAIAAELDKLSVYRWGGTITAQDVYDLVSYSREASIFAAVDAIVEGAPQKAIAAVETLLRDGRPAAYILTMIARQVRLLLLAKELKANRAQPSEQGRRLGLSGYPLQKAMQQEQRFTAQRLVAVHGLLLEADLAMKSSSVGDELLLDMLIAQVSGNAAPRRTGGIPR